MLTRCEDWRRGQQSEQRSTTRKSASQAAGIGAVVRNVSRALQRGDLHSQAVGIGAPVSDVKHT
jgi:hypothetical protein